MIIQDPKNRALATAAVAFIFALLCLIIGFVLYYPYLKGKKKPQYGVKRTNFIDYLNDAYKILSFHRSIGLLIMGCIFLITSIIFFIIGIFG